MSNPYISDRGAPRSAYRPQRSGPPLVERARHFDLETVGYLRRVYALFFGGIISASAGAMTALYAGAGAGVPPLVAWFANHWLLAIVAYFAAFFGMNAVRRIPRVNAVALFGFTFFTGLYIAPILYIAGLMATAGETMTANPVRDAFLLAVSAFGGLTGYALVTKRDFSFLRGFLTMGIFVLLGAMLIGMFVGGAVFQLAIASVGVLLFGAYVLYDTSRMLRSGERSDPVGAALGLYLNFLNIFLFILRIFMSGSRRS
jgi:modulator of FtsH protease